MIQASAQIQERIQSLPVAPEFQRRINVILEHCNRNLQSVDEPMLRKAFRVSHWAHRHDTRASGEPYLYHPLAVALIVARDIRVDDTSVAAALLHDVVEDTDITLEFIEEVFGEEIGQIIDGLTKIEGMFKSRELGRAENARKLILSMATDVRVVLVKFADRLHNMQTLGSLKETKQFKIASDTLDFFVPLAHRFGLFAIKSELEDLCLKAMDREAYNAIAQGLAQKKEFRERYVSRFMAPIKESLEKVGFQFDIKGRSKSIHSIYNKMRNQRKTLEEIFDLYAVRIILHSEGRQGKEDCWRVYSMITDSYKPLPERFRDFVSVPKSNGYQSLHTTVLGPDGRRVEVQIRTREMDEVAERGIAAHWKYKEGDAGKGDRMDGWFAWVRDVLENPQDEAATEFLQDFRLNLFAEEIYVFSPRGDVYTLPKGATPVDFAFDVHTEVGYHCIGAKVNGKMEPLSYQLQSGDQVEILTSKKQTPNHDWIKFVVTSKARARIRHQINEERRVLVERGKEIWAKKAKKAKLELDNQDLHRLSKRLKFPNTKQMFSEMGQGLFDPDDLVAAARRTQPVDEPIRTDRSPEEEIRAQYETFIDAAQQQGERVLLIEGEVQKNMQVAYASCCNPIPGDRVFGFVSRGRGIRIHRRSCKNAKNLFLEHPDRVVSVDWSRQKDATFVAALRIVGEDRVGMVSDLTTVISKNLKTNIRSLTVNARDGIFEGNIVLDVADLDHLSHLINRLLRLTGVHGVYRFEE